MAVTSRKGKVFAFVTVALLHFSLKNQTEISLVRHSIQILSKSFVTNNILGPPIYDDCHSLSLLFNKIKKILAEFKEELKKCE